MKLIDLQKQTATVTSTATITLGTVVDKFRTVAQAIAAGDLAVGDTGIPFFVRDPASGAWEAGLYTITSATQLTREKVLSGSNGTSAVAFGSVACEVYSALPGKTVAQLANAPAGTIKGVKNLKHANTAQIRAAIARGRAGQGPARIARIGDSTTAGAGAGANSGGSATGCGNAFVSNPMSKLAALLQAAGIKAGQGGFAGSGYVDTTTYPAYDSRVTLNGFAVNNVATLGGYFFLATTAGATMSINPGRAFDRVRVYFAVAGPNGSFSVNVDGGAAITSRSDSPSSPSSTVINTAGSPNDFTYVDFDVPSGLHTVNVVSTGATQVFVAGIQTWNSADHIRLMTLGHWGKKIADVIDASAPWAPLSALAKYSPELLIVSLTINDTTQGTSKADYQARLETLIIEALKYGDVMLGLGAVSNDVTSANGGLWAIQSAVNELSQTYDLPVISFPAVAGNFANASAKGWMFDQVHPSSTGYDQEAAMTYATVKWLLDNAA